MNAHLDMSLRDWFAGLAMKAMIGRGDLYLDNNTMVAITHDSYEFADAMLAERKRIAE